MNAAAAQPEDQAGTEATGHVIVLFDGVCNLCAWAVQFIVARDRRERFRFASLQSELGQRLVAQHCPGLTTLSTFVLIEDGQGYMESSAALRVARHLDGLWPLCYGAIILPRFLRDAAYRFIAQRRYRWFGRQDACMIPSPELRRRFLS